MRILVTDGMDKTAMAQLREHGHEVVEQFYEPDQLGAALRDFDAVVVRSKTKVRANHIDEAKGGKLKLIIREDLIRDDLDPKTPIYLMYKTHADNGSMYNTPNCWAIYCCGKVFKYLLNMGGLEEMEKRNIEKAKVLYDFLDSSKLFKGAVVPQDRSLMNVPFVTGDKDLDAAVVAASKEAGFDNLKGHKSVGGLRASIYNAMPKEGVEALVEFLTKFEAEHQA